MCTILLAWRLHPDAPIVLAANRDEFLARPSLPPHVLRQSPLIAGGQDALAGGTWLAVRGDGTLAAVTNRRAGERDPSRRSRGELPLALLDAPDDNAASTRLHALRAADYNPFNALYVSPTCALVAQAHGASLDVRQLDPGLHVLTVYDLDDRTHPKVAFLSGRLNTLAAQQPAADPLALLAAMETLLQEHGEPGREGPEAACVHGDGYGTVSSSSVLVDSGGGIVYRHALGRPCTTPRTDVSDLLGARLAQPPAPSG